MFSKLKLKERNLYLIIDFIKYAIFFNKKQLKNIQLYIELLIKSIKYIKVVKIHTI